MDGLKHRISDTIIFKTTVQSYELDFFHHVNNAVYLNWLESARVFFLKEKGMSFDDFLKQSAVPVVASVHMEFKKPAYMDDEISIHTWISSKKRVAMTISYELFNQKNDLIHTADSVLVFVDKSGKAANIPESYLAMMTE